MVSAAKLQTQLPLKRFKGVNQQLDLYRDHVVVSRNDPLARFIPGIFGSHEEIPVDHISHTYIHDIKYGESRLLHLVLALTSHRHVGIMFPRADYEAAEAMKNRIDEMLGKREMYPPVMK